MERVSRDAFALLSGPRLLCCKVACKSKVENMLRSVECIARRGCDGMGWDGKAVRLDQT